MDIQAALCAHSGVADPGYNKKAGIIDPGSF
jgi:hypothetical protein